MLSFSESLSHIFLFKVNRKTKNGRLKMRFDSVFLGNHCSSKQPFNYFRLLVASAIQLHFRMTNSRSIYRLATFLLIVLMFFEAFTWIIRCAFFFIPRPYPTSNSTVSNATITIESPYLRNIQTITAFVLDIFASFMPLFLSLVVILGFTLGYICCIPLVVCSFFFIWFKQKPERAKEVWSFKRDSFFYALMQPVPNFVFSFAWSWWLSFLWWES